MAEVVRVWPPRTLADSDPLSLGVFPARLPGPYVPRDADGALQVALRGGGLVLLFGPPRSGKSRAALEWRAWRCSGPVRWLIPADGAALSALAEPTRRASAGAATVLRVVAGRSGALRRPPRRRRTVTAGRWRTHGGDLRCARTPGTHCCRVRAMPVSAEGDCSGAASIVRVSQVLERGGGQRRRRARYPGLGSGRWHRQRVELPR